MTTKAVPCCARCFATRNPQRQPVRLAEAWRATEVCHYCAEETDAGIYVRVLVRPTPRSL